MNSTANITSPVFHGADGNNTLDRDIANLTAFWGNESVYEQWYSHDSMRNNDSIGHGYFVDQGELSVYLSAVNVTINFSQIRGNDSNFTSDEYIVTTTVSATKVLLGLFLSLCCMVTVLGNILVMVAVSRMSYLRTVTNFFIVSLAVADLLVGSIIIPFTITLEMTGGYWPFGVIWCDLWRSFDVLSATASIMNLCVISLDRYWAITDPISYPGRMSFKRAYITIFFVWFCSMSISFPAIAWWRAVDPIDNGKNVCLFTDDTLYRILSSCISFYVPLFVMVFVYYKIYRAAAIQMRSLRRGMKTLNNDADFKGGVLTLRIHRGGGAAYRTHNHVNGNSTHETDSLDSQIRRGNRAMPVRRLHISKRFIRLAKERKAAKTLGIVMGVFIICWLPFFVLNVLYGICGDVCVENADLLYNLFTWLGYLNSGVNPFIYAFSSRDFKRAFIKILCTCLPTNLNTQIHMPRRPKQRKNSNTFSSHVETTILSI
ncbi:dopamine receptor 2-like [Saccoglossus kowalevskii]|uniref:Dopamine receptor 2-like n=1 Tax=Saccoglossus kowalevskii TaxID=10224 RepID=A0ABM0N0E2_SACKO|nr:PREDICTED: dopamine receptor 2-like [Saccoglossus kowalevskii]